MEAGRDKANKNKIEVNDPVMLTGLAKPITTTRNSPRILRYFLK